MAKKQEVKMSKRDILDKCIKTVEYAIVPVTTILSIWDIDAGVYVAAIAGFIISGLRLAEVFIKD